MITSEKKFGQVVSVIDNIPYKFDVRGIRLGADSSNRYNEITFGYLFTDLSKHQSLGKSKFQVKISDEVENLYSKEDDLHNAAILFGLSSKKKNPKDMKFEVSLDDWNTFASQKRLEGQELCAEILKFYLTFYKIWPGQGIGLPDLLDNFNNTEEELQQWHLHLIHAQSIVRKQGNVTFRKDRGDFATSAYTINPMKFQEIEIELNENEQQVGLIDPRNHRYFKLNPTQSEVSGKFALVLMPFKEKEFPQEVFDKVFKPVVRRVLGINCVKVNSDKLKDFLENKIYSHLIKSELIISELSTENPNVIFELGLSFALEKSIITTFHNKFAKSEKRLSFDYEHFDTIFYNDYDELESELEAALEAHKVV